VLATVLVDAIGLRPDQVEGPEELRHLVLEGDWVARPTASTAKKIAVLERALEEATGRRIRFDRREVPYSGATSEVWTIREEPAPATAPTSARSSE
jgi:hypothetical protein